MDAGYKNPGNTVHLVEKISNDDQDVRAADPADMGIEALLAHLHVSQGGAEIAQFRKAQLGKLNFADQVLVGNAKEVAERDGVGQQGFFLKVIGIHLDGIEQGGGQVDRGLQGASAQVFHQD